MKFSRGDVVCWEMNGHGLILGVVSGAQEDDEYEDDEHVWMWCTHPGSGVFQDGQKWLPPDELVLLGHVDIDTRS